jgi:predicted metal-dependent phosphoesterase TrpH
VNVTRPPESGGRRVDLHAHTVFSDGTLTPEALLDHARSRNVGILGITDHDNVDAVPFALAAAGDVMVVPGIEISSALDNLDLHMLGYFIDHTNEALRARLTGFRDERRNRAQAILDKLTALGVPVDADEVFAAAGPGVVGRPHVAQALVKAGHVPNIDMAFQRYLGPRGAAFIQRPAFHSEEAIATIHAAGGAAVLAHPGGSLPEHIAERLRDAGLDGVEVWHPQHGANAVRRWHETAKKLGLIESGGSDFHGPHRGAGLGDMPVPERTVELLRAAASR